MASLKQDRFQYCAQWSTDLTFKQALSTLQQLKQKEEGAQRNQQWAPSSSSSSWWSWQGSWWTPIPMKVTMEMNQSTYRRGVTCHTSIWNKSSGP